MPLIIFLLSYGDLDHYLTQVAPLLFCLKSDVGPSDLPSIFAQKILQRSRCPSEPVHGCSSPVSSLRLVHVRANACLPQDVSSVSMPW